MERRVLKRLLNRIRRVRREMWDAGGWFWCTTMRYHIPLSLLSSSWLKKEVFVIGYPPYSPDFTPKDFMLFPELKAECYGSHEENPF